MHFQNLIETLQYRAERHPDRVALRFLEDGETETRALSYGEINRRALSVAAGLKEKVAPGERVLVSCPQNPAFIEAFLGCLYAGMIAVPVPPPRNERMGKKVALVAEDCGARFALFASDGKAHFPKTLTLLSVDQVVGDTKPTVHQELAFLQYTSGSTGNPKGVMVSHRNLVSNFEMMVHGSGHTEKTVIVSWLPFYHDMGLIGCVLTPLYVGFESVLLSPAHFLEQPLRWFQAISRYKGTCIMGPNFSYDLCVRKLKGNEKEIDLSSLEVACNAAEPIRASTVEQFFEAFSKFGLKRKALFLGYGLAEATVYASGKNVANKIAIAVDKELLQQNKFVPSSKPHARIVVGAGVPPEGENIAIVNPDTKSRCAPGEIGEIWIQGANVCLGYWNKPELSQAIFRAELRGEKGEYLRTGDLGTIFEGQLVITGRLKDLIIMHGKNHYPQDIELTVESLSCGIRPAGCVAISSSGDATEELLVVAEIERTHLKDNLEAAAKNVQSALVQEHEIRARQIVFVKPGSLPKTTSGKVQRQLTKSLFFEGRLSSVFAWPNDYVASEDASL